MHMPQLRTSLPASHPLPAPADEGEEEEEGEEAFSEDEQADEEEEGSETEGCLAVSSGADCSSCLLPWALSYTRVVACREAGCFADYAFPQPDMRLGTEGCWQH